MVARWPIAALIAAGVVAVSTTALSQDQDEMVRVSIEPAADEALREMGDVLAKAEAFTFEAEVRYDSVTSGGEKLQFGGTASIAVKRPTCISSIFRGDERHSRVSFDGETFAAYHLEKNMYAETDQVGSTIEEVLDYIFDNYDVSLPIADLISDDPYAVMIGHADEGRVVSRHFDGQNIIVHLAFRQEFIDWQIWIEDGPRPLPRRLVITHKTEPGSPQYSATLSNWDFAPHLQCSSFDFDPPAGATRIEFANLGEPEEGEE